MNQPAVKVAARDIVVDEIFPHAPETIWKTLTNGELMARWIQMTPAGFAAVKGNRFTFQTTPAGPWDGAIRCEILELIPHERLVFSWRSGDETNVGDGSRIVTVVTFTLVRVDQGTRLRLVHSGFVLPKNETGYRSMSEGWKKVVQNIGAFAGEQADPKKRH
jgi:uncharacterized protein YndB with AHSA1/START domain